MPVKKKPKKVSYYKNKADALFSKIIREPAYCFYCKQRNLKLDCAHIITRANQRLRYDPMNAIPLCARCHMWGWHENPLIYVKWFREKFPDRYEYLMFVKNFPLMRKPYDWEQLIENLKNRNLNALMAPKELLDQMT